MDPRSVEFTLPRTRSGEESAREILGDLLPEGTDLLDRAMLLLSELFASDRVLGGAEGAEVGVRVDADGDTVRIEVRDGGSGLILDALRHPSTTGRAGWSTHLLSSVADRWGLVSGDIGAWVWFELDLPALVQP